MILNAPTDPTSTDRVYQTQLLQVRGHILLSDALYFYLAHISFFESFGCLSKVKYIDGLAHVSLDPPTSSLFSFHHLGSGAMITLRKPFTAFRRSLSKSTTSFRRPDC